jgi:hypothetical protein
VPERKMIIDHGETAVLPEHLRPDRVDALAGAAAEAQMRYQEYLRSLDEVPVLVDVVREPPRVAIRDFRSGQRRNERKAPRDDAGELREQHEREVGQQYAEYVAVDAALVSTKRAGPRQTPAKAGRKSGAQKKRAKRAKRSARSKA